MELNKRIQEVVKYLDNLSEKRDIYVTTCLRDFYETMYDRYESMHYVEKCEWVNRMINENVDEEYIDDNFQDVYSHKEDYGMHNNGIIYINHQLHLENYGMMDNVVMKGEMDLQEKYGDDCINSEIITLIHEYVHYHLGHGKHNKEHRRKMKQLCSKVFNY